MSRRVPGAARRCVWAVLLAMLVTVATSVQARSPEGAVLAPFQVLASETPSPPPETATWEAAVRSDGTALPWLRSYPGTVWLQTHFDAPDAAAATWAVYLPYLYDGGDLWLNGTPIGRIAQDSPTVQVRWERPHLVVLPAGLLRPQGNRLAIRAAAGAPGTLRHLPLVSVGPQVQLQAGYDWRMFWVRTMPQVTVVVCLLVAGFVLFIWWRRPSETLYGVFGVTAALWGIRTLTFVIEQMPVDHWQLWRMAYLGATGGFVVGMAIFALRHAGVVRPRLERALVIYALLGPAWLGIQGRAAEPLVNRYWSAGLIPIGLAILGIALWHLRRQRTLAAAIMPTATIVAVLAGVHDYLVAWDGDTMSRLWPHWAAQRIFLLHHGANLLLLAMGGLLTARFIAALTGLEELNHTLEARVSERERHLAANFERMATLQKQHAAAQERQLIMREIHDGLGSRLFTSLSRVERGDIGSAQVADTLRDCIGDMRLALDALTPGEDDFRVVLGNFLFRWQAQLEDVHVRSSWTIDWPESAPPLPPPSVLQLLRITQEALTNVLKHAQATHVRVALRHAGAGLELEVEDDGRASTLPVRSGGRGLANMHTRARQLGGVLAVEHGGRGTRVLLRVPAGAERIGAAHAIA